MRFLGGSAAPAMDNRGSQRMMVPRNGLLVAEGNK
jgi:hypothetical protein